MAVGDLFSSINDDLLEQVLQPIIENLRLTIAGVNSHFPQISRSLLHEITIKHLLFKKVCARWVPKNLTHKMKRYHDDGDEFVDRLFTSDET